MAEFSLESMKGKDLEEAVLERAAQYKRLGTAHVSRCGVQAVMIGIDQSTGAPKWQVIRSLPDFEGVNSLGQQFIFDAKVCSLASFDLTPYRAETAGTKSRQLKHMFERSQFGVACFFLMHWNARSGKRFKEPHQTYLFPIVWNSDFWHGFLSAEIRSINRRHCEELGTVVEWNAADGGRKLRPDYLAAMSEHFLKQMV